MLGAVPGTCDRERIGGSTGMANRLPQPCYTFITSFGLEDPLTSLTAAPAMRPFVFLVPSTLSPWELCICSHQLRQCQRQGGRGHAA